MANPCYNAMAKQQASFSGSYGGLFRLMKQNSGLWLDGAPNCLQSLQWYLLLRITLTPGVAMMAVCINLATAAGCYLIGASAGMLCFAAPYTHIVVMP